MKVSRIELKFRGGGYFIIKYDDPDVEPEHIRIYKGGKPLSEDEIGQDPYLVGLREGLTVCRVR